MSSDLSPEQIDAQENSTISLTLEEAVQTEDIGAQPGPEDLEKILSEHSDVLTAANLSRVKWPSKDENAPDYAYVKDESATDTFKLTPDVLEELIKLNRYEPQRSKNVIAFALRGCQLTSGHEVELSDSVDLKNVRPDHRNVRCVIGFYFTDTKKITVYTGSTVPCRLAIWSYRNGGSKSNMLPTGMYAYYIWRHKLIKPALRMSISSSNLELGAEATVLRNKNNYIIETKDIFNLSTPYDNIHCSYHLNEDEDLGATFSSWGCLTVRGAKTPSHQWKKFQSTLENIGREERVDLLLATGKDAAIAATNLDTPSELSSKLTALRSGSRGIEVEKIQEKLGIGKTGFFGAKTLDHFTAFQRSFNKDAGKGAVADGIYSLTMDKLTNWNVFEDSEADS